MSVANYRGASLEQDPRFSDQRKKLKRQIPFPDCFKTKVDMGAVKLAAFEPWINEKVTAILGTEDEVLVDMMLTMLEARDLDPRDFQIDLAPMLGGHQTPAFVKELWELLISAANSGFGLPQSWLDAKKEELRLKKEEADRIAAELRKKEEAEAEARAQVRAAQEQALKRAREARRSAGGSGADQRGRRGRSRSPRRDRRSAASSAHRRDRRGSPPRRRDRRHRRSRSPRRDRSRDRGRRRRRSRSRDRSRERRRRGRDEKDGDRDEKDVDGGKELADQPAPVPTHARKTGDTEADDEPEAKAEAGPEVKAEEGSE